MKSLIKQALPHIISILAFVIVSSAYFYPAWEGKSLQQDDVAHGRGSVSEKIRYQTYENKETLWNNTIFSGMPEFLGARYKGASNLWRIWIIPEKIGIPQEISFLIWYMLGFYILLVALNVNPWLAMAGAISFGLTSYNVILINAGHFMKVRTIALIAPVLGGVFLIFRKKYILGFVITALFLAMQVSMGHVQMSYYFLLGLICIGLAQFFYHFKEKELLNFSKAISFLLLAAMMGVAPNYAKLYNYYKYNQQTIRGKSELTIGKDESVKTNKGLDRDYINMWSSGRTESMMLFAPNAKGGASAYVKQDRDLLKQVDSRFKETIGNMNQYWGDQQPASGGPNSAGAAIVTLFIIGLFLIKGPIKKGVLAAVILFIFLSWGEHFAVFTNLFIDYVPLYNKFRTPVSILGVGVIFITFFAFYTASQIIKNPDLLSTESKLKWNKKPIPLYFVAGMGFVLFILLNIALPNLFNSYLNESELAMFNNARTQGNATQINQLINALENLRIHVFRIEFLRTLLFSAAIVLSLILFKQNKLNRNALIAVVAILSIIDVWSIAQRYVSSDDFSKRNRITAEFRLSDIDKQIYAREIRQNPSLQAKMDEALEKFHPNTEEGKEDIQSYIMGKYSFYRVYNLTQSPFQENFTSNAHRSVGGYHAVKLRRYQDMIEHHLSKGNQEVLNMLNAKYIITQNGLQINPGVPGPAWFADTVIWAQNANEEILDLNNFNLNQAIINVKDKELVTAFEPSTTDDKIELEYAEPDRIKYRSKSRGNRMVLFSEVYYPDWKVLVDGKEADYFTANYILRCMIVPEGEHEIEFIFKPDYFYRSNTISSIMFAILLLFLGGAILFEGLKYYKKTAVQNN